jgi:sialic acid synthase SpsE
VEFAASAFDVKRVRWLERLGVKRHKVASRSIDDLAVIVAMKETQKQIIASLGNHSGPLFPDFKADFLYCVTRRQILRDGFDSEKFFWALRNGHSGFSDHTVGNDWAKQAIGEGVKILEKHITIDKNAAGWDQPSSADFNDMFEIGERCGKG